MSEWYGSVTDIDGDMFTAILGREGSPDLVADFSMAECGLSEIKPGDVIVVTPEAVRRLEPRAWTQEELDEILMYAREMSKTLRGKCDADD